MTASELLQLGMQHHQGGRLEQAEQIYRQILATEPNHIDALHLIGVLAHQQGNSQLAVDYIQRVIALQPGAADAHYNLALAQQALKRHDAAVAAFRQALRLGPKPTAVLHYHLGNALAEQRLFGDAVASYRCALELEPEHNGARINLARALTQLGLLEEAVVCYRQSLKNVPQIAETHYRLALVLKQQGKPREAEEELVQALRLKPQFADAHHQLGGVLIEQQRETEALRHLEEAVRLKPDDAEIHNNLANLCRVQGLLERAVRHGREAVRLAPAFVEAHSNLGVALRDCGQPDAALQSYEQALRLQPDYPDAHWNRALAWLLEGNYLAGWEEYEWRFKRRGQEPRRFAQPAWDGSPLNGRTILLYAEQGIGDTLQFIRYAAAVKRQGGTVIVECQKELARLLRTCDGVDRVVARGATLPAFDLQAALMSLPRIFGTALETIPAKVPYLRADAERMHEFRRTLAASGTLRVGIVWRGNPAHQNDRFRSLKLTQLLPLAEVPGVTLYSLQKGAGREALAALSGSAVVVDLAEQLHDFYDTAALVASLDVVVGCDTSVAHLAGALAMPVWVMLPAAPDWRWLRERADSPWYPTVKLLRQQRLGDWEDVVEAAAQSLKRFAPGVHERS